jgi:ribosome recycling factor
MQEMYKDAERRMQQAVEATAHDFQKIRTGRANPNILEHIKVDYYGVETPINQVGSVSVPEARQLLITPYDKNLLGEIERSLLKSDLGVTPNNDGNNIRLTFPQMTEERRKEMIKQVHQRGEEGCIAVRNVRKDAMHKVHDAEKAKEITEDENKSWEKKVQELTDKYVNKVHEIQKAKDAEVMEI